MCNDVPGMRKRGSRKHNIFNLFATVLFCISGCGHLADHCQDQSYRNDPQFSDRYAWANSADPDQTAPLQTASRGAVLSGSTLFAIPCALFGLIILW